MQVGLVQRRFQFDARQSSTIAPRLPTSRALRVSFVDVLPRYLVDGLLRTNSRWGMHINRWRDDDTARHLRLLL